MLTRPSWPTPSLLPIDGTTAKPVHAVRRLAVDAFESKFVADPDMEVTRGEPAQGNFVIAVWEAPASTAGETSPLIGSIPIRAQCVGLVRLSLALGQNHQAVNVGLCLEVREKFG